MYKFIKTKDETNSYDTTNVTVEVTDSNVLLSDLLQSIGEFLLACGYSPEALREKGVIE